GHVRARDDEHVPRMKLSQVEKRDDISIFGHHRRRSAPRDDLVERTRRRWYERSHGARSATAIASMEKSSPRGSATTGAERTGGLPGKNSSNSAFSVGNAAASAMKHV